MIEAHGLTKHYGAKTVIKALNFTVKRGEIVGLLGLNGAGKSTVLKIIAASLQPSSGYAVIDGQAITARSTQVRRIIGFLPDSPPLYLEMTVGSYLHHVLRLKLGRIDKRVATDMVDAAISRTSLTTVVNHRLGALSHGFRQRVGIAQAIVHQPVVLILDEPINGLDPVQIIAMRDLIKSLRQQHTVLLASHILSEITKTCDRILVLHAGKLSSLRDSKSTSLQCEVRADPKPVMAQLRALTGVEQVDWQATAAGSYRLVLRTNTDVRAQVAELLCPYALLLLQEKYSDLEQMFHSLVQD